jgi:hypothetical protein
MTHWHVGETRILTARFELGNTPTDAAAINLRYKIGTNTTETVVPVTRDAAGNYSAKVTPTESGNMFVRWDSDGTYDVVEEPIYHIKESKFE